MNPHDPHAPTHGDAASNRRQALSDLADGQADAAQVATACQTWRDDPAARQTWHAYQLIGDVLRSDELARPASADASFLSRLRSRLADEPVVLAPQAHAAREAAPVAAAEAVRPRPSAPRWWFASAVAAGFCAVAGVLVVTRVAAPDPAPGAAVQARAPLAAEGGTVMIRNAGLDAYLRAHQSARGGAAVAVPGGMVMRSAEVLLPADAPR